MEATIMVVEIKAKGRTKILHQRLHLLRESKTAKITPTMRLAIETERRKKTRGLLPLQMDHRMKFGWD